MQGDREQDNRASVDKDNEHIDGDELQKIEDLAGMANVVQVDMNFDEDKEKTTSVIATADVSAL